MQQGDEDMLLPLALPSMPGPGRTSSGGSKVKARNALPEVFFAAGAKPRELHGAMLLTACCTSASGDSYVVLGGVCALSEPLAIGEGSATRSNGLFKVDGQLELRARSALTAQGDSQRTLQRLRS